MTFYTISARETSRADRPLNPEHRDRDDGPTLGKQGLVVNPPGCEHAAKAARAAVFVEFGPHAFAIDHTDFVDRRPWELRRAENTRM